MPDAVHWTLVLSANSTYLVMMPKRTKCRKDAAGNKLCLLKWLEDETVSMLPMKAAKDGQKVYQSVCVDGLCQCVRVHSVSLHVCV